MSLKLILPTALYIASIALIVIDPAFLNPETYQSKVIYRGCYEGTVNTGVIYFRESGKFEHRHGGAFGFTTYRDGTWNSDGLKAFFELTPTLLAYYQLVSPFLLLLLSRYETES